MNKVHGKRWGSGGRSAPGLMRKLGVFAVAFVLVASACGVGGQGGDERTVRVDFSHDEFASAMFANFPKEIAVPQGAKVVFKQTWTGEPHTVTGGTLVDEMMEKGQPFMDLFTGFEQLAASEQGLPDPAEDADLTVAEFFEAVEAADDEQAKRQLIAGYDALRDDLDLPARDDPDNAETKASVLDEKVGPAADEFFEDLGIPWAIDENDEGAFITQNAGQPCYIDSGAPPKDADEPCPEADQRQPAFDGKATYYNSGMIPFEGQRGNTFEVEFSDDIQTGDYWFYCAVHGPGQSTKVNVVEAGEEAPAQEAVSREARQEISEFSRPMLEAFREARDGEIDMEGETVEGPFAGLSVPVHGAINEFVPKTIETEIGEPVTWKIMGADHTITFDVPEYFPVMRFARNGEVTFNPRLQEPAGGSPPLPENEEEGPPGTGAPVEIDGGTYDGSGFFSSGLFGGEPFASYTLRFSKPGTYKYACLLHPPMVGTVEVT